MNGNNNIQVVCNRKQISTNLPLKKRRNYRIDIQSVQEEQDENISKRKKQSHSATQDDSFRVHLPSSPVVPTTPSPSHLELYRQQYAYLLANSTNLFHPSVYEAFMAEKLLTQRQHFDYYRALLERQQSATTVVDEYSQSSSGEKHHQPTTLDDSHSSSSTSADSIEEHFARSLAKFWSSPAGESGTSLMDRQKTELVVDDHFAKALGSTTWEKLKEKS